MDRLPSGEPAMGGSGQINCGFNDEPDGGYGTADPEQINFGLESVPPVGSTAPAGNGGGFDVNFQAVAPLKFQPGEITTHALPMPLA